MNLPQESITDPTPRSPDSNARRRAGDLSIPRWVRGIGSWVSPLVACMACSAPGRFEGALSGPPRWSQEPLLDESILFGKGRSNLEILGSDLAAIPASLFGDIKASVTNSANWPLLGGAVLSGAVLRQTGLNDRYARESHELERLPSIASDLLDITGEGHVLMGVGAGLYAWGLLGRDGHHYRAGRTALAAMAATGTLTLATKLLVQDGRPNGGSLGYPSGHTSMSVALATSLHSSYGWKVSLPAYAVSGLVALQRVDSGAHDLEDVLVGAALGFVVTRQVHSQRGLQFLGADVSPFYEPTNGGVGLSLHWSR